MSYHFFLDGIELPITPSALKIKINNQNKTINLLNDGEVNILKEQGLKDISFTFEIPQAYYPYANTTRTKADYYLTKLLELKDSIEPFRFVVTRSYPNKKRTFDTNMAVSLEEFEVEEDAENGMDIRINISLKEFRDYGTKKMKIKQSMISNSTPIVKQEPQRQTSSKNAYIGCECIVNGTLHRDSYGSGAGKTLTNYKGKINLINTKGSHPYHVTTPDGGWLGWVLASAISNVV